MPRLTSKDMLADPNLPQWVKDKVAKVVADRDGKPTAAQPIDTKRQQSHTPGVMNKWERAYADDLDLRKWQEVKAWWFESVKFRLAEGCWYCPDFLVQFCDGRFEIHEVKGHWRDDARVKAKVIAESFPFPLYIVKRGAGGTGWSVEFVPKRPS